MWPQVSHRWWDVSQRIGAPQLSHGARPPITGWQVGDAWEVVSRSMPSTVAPQGLEHRRATRHDERGREAAMNVQLQAPGACDVDVDEPVVISIEETPTTGYQWEVASPPPAVTVDDTRFEPPTSEAPGAAGRRVITLRATEAGEHRVRLQRRRAWEPAAAETVEVVVNAS